MTREEGPGALDLMKIFRISEGNVDSIILSLGGEKLSTGQAQKESKPTADYRLNEAVIELKLIQEEGFQKVGRQAKLADLFKKNQPNSPVVILHPGLLDDGEQKKYGGIVEGPIKNAIRKADYQLKETSLREHGMTRVLLIINNGYQALSASEFEETVVKRATNLRDAAHIDYVIVTGLYFYGDGFDHYAFTEFKLVPLNVAAPLPSFEVFKDGWDEMINRLMTEYMREPAKLKLDRLPVVDVHFEKDGVAYVKPPPPMGKKSQFYPHGRPRANSSGLKTCPPVGTILPHLDQEDWAQLRRRLDTFYLRNSYKEYLEWLDQVERTEGKIRVPIVKMPISFSKGNARMNRISQISDLEDIALRMFALKVKSIAEAAKEVDKVLVEPVSYLYLEVIEIGKDKNFDLASLWLVRNIFATPSTERVFAKERIFYEYALLLSASYAIKYSIEHIIYKRETTFGWV